MDHACGSSKPVSEISYALLQEKFIMRCAYVDENTSIAYGYSKEKYGIFDAKPKNFSEVFEGGCR